MSRLKPSWILLVLLLFVLVDGGIVATVLGEKETRSLLVFVYGAVVTVFLGIVLAGFILSQTRYWRSVEDPKFRMLSEEMREWKS